MTVPKPADGSGYAVVRRTVNTTAEVFRRVGVATFVDVRRQAETTFEVGWCSVRRMPCDVDLCTSNFEL